MSEKKIYVSDVAEVSGEMTRRLPFGQRGSVLGRGEVYRVKKFVLVKNYSSDFQEPVWERRWQEPGRDLSFALEQLSELRTCSGFGIRSPFAILVGPHTVCTQTLGTTQTLADDLNHSRHFGLSEDLVRSVGEQICYGLHRLHQGLGRAYGAVYPYNIGHDDAYDRNYFLWSAPTAHLEAANTPFYEMDRRWDLPYRAPEVSAEKPPGIEADIFGLGRVLYQICSQQVREQYRELLEGHDVDRIEQSLVEILRKAQLLDPEHRFRSAASLAEALNPETRLTELDILHGQTMLKRGIESFHRGEYKKAEEYWLEAQRRDWLSVAVWNNLAVCKMREQKWEAADEDLQKALRLDLCHAVVRCNLAFCRIRLGRVEDSERYATEAVAMRPDLVAGRIVLSNLSFQKGLASQALYHASEAILWHPTSRSARWQHLRLLRKLGREEEAARDEALLEALEYRVPFVDFLIDDTTSPPWGRVRRDDSLPRYDDDDDPNPDDTGSRVPLNPMPPLPSGTAKISSKNYRKGIRE